MMFDFYKCNLVEIDESKEYHICNLFYFGKEKIKKNYNSMGINTDESMKDEINKESKSKEKINKKESIKTGHEKGKGSSKVTKNVKYSKGRESMSHNFNLKISSPKIDQKFKIGSHQSSNLDYLSKIN